DDGLRDVELVMIATGASVGIGGAGRRLEIVLPELRLLPCSWGYDEETRTLLTGDIFSWVWWDRPDGPWVLDDGVEDPTTPERLEAFLLHGRYWWLAGADTAPLRRGLADLFERYRIDAIGPDHGCILRGAAVARH